MSWQLGLMFICGFIVAIWAAAEILIEDRTDWKRLRDIEAGRLAQRADYIENSAFYHREKP